jgi:hypothetical protein
VGRSRRKLDDFALVEVDFQIGDLGAESRPREGRVDADDVAARPVGDGFEEIAPGTVDLGEGDEGASQVVPARGAKLQGVEVEAQRLRGFLPRPLWASRRP